MRWPRPGSCLVFVSTGLPWPSLPWSCRPGVFLPFAWFLEPWGRAGAERWEFAAQCLLITFQGDGQVEFSAEPPSSVVWPQSGGPGGSAWGSRLRGSPAAWLGSQRVCLCVFWARPAPLSCRGGLVLPVRQGGSLAQGGALCGCCFLSNTSKILFS